jgi:predicted nucleic acid-binding Zn ribbon protein
MGSTDKKEEKKEEISVKKDVELTEKDKDEVKKVLDMYKLNDDELTMEAQFKLKMPKNKMESKFMIDVTTEYLKNLHDTKNEKFISANKELLMAEQLYNENKFTESLAHAMRAKRICGFTDETMNVTGEGRINENSTKVESIIKCSSCGNAVAINDKFCKECGKNLMPLKCPGCGKSIESSDKFCSNCGYKLK